MDLRTSGILLTQSISFRPRKNILKWTRPQHPIGVSPTCFEPDRDFLTVGKLGGIGWIRILELHHRIPIVLRIGGNLLLKPVVRLELTIDAVLVDFLQHRNHVNLFRRPAELMTHNMATFVFLIGASHQIITVLVHLGLDMARPRPERITNSIKPVDLQAHRPHLSSATLSASTGVHMSPATFHSGPQIPIFIQSGIAPGSRGKTSSSLAQSSAV